MDAFLARMNADKSVSLDEILRMATDAADVGWWDVEGGHGRLSWPARTKAMFGISPDAPVTMDDFYAGLHPDDHDRVAVFYASAADPSRRAIYDVEYRTIGKEDGVVRWVAAKGRGFFDDTGRCIRVIGTAIDITERKRIEQEWLAHQREEAELREQFLAVLGHDLRNPLAAVSAGTDLIVRHPEQAAEIADQIKQSISRMSALIDNILDFARGRLGGGIETKFDTEPLEPILRHVIEELKVVHPRQEVMTDFEFREAVICDRVRIGQILSNLLANAFDYGEPETPIHLRARSEKGRFELAVTNNGATIDKASLDRLFQPFFRGKARGRREGLGLGLYICSEIARAHGGTIEVKSENGKTCFTFSMPTGAE